MPKIDELRALSRIYSPAIIAITETWLSPIVTDSEISIPNYLLYRRDRCSQNGGGVAIYVRTIFSSHLICTPTQFSHLELLIVSLIFPL